MDLGCADPGVSAAHPIYVWRHPRPQGAEGHCIGHTDLAIDPRKGRRLARRIDRFAQRSRLPRIVATSPLRRCADVGRWLRRKGWEHRLDAALLELDFGAWDGLRWDDVPRAEIDAWCSDFAHYRPGGGESLVALLERTAAWSRDGVHVVIAHAGWMQALQWLSAHGTDMPTPAQWPQAARYGGGPLGFAR